MKERLASGSPLRAARIERPTAGADRRSARF